MQDASQLPIEGLDWAPSWVAGVDEAGRGPLAGPVVAAAVVLDPARPIDGLRDSKKLTAARRERLAAQIREQAASFHIVHVDAAEIDRINILQASLRAMERAVAGLERLPDVAYIDGNQLPKLSCPAVALVKGDDRMSAISAASILAKVDRDRWMCEAAQRYPGYGFEGHKGYGTRAHLEALAELGPCDLHRRSFAPVARRLAAAEAGA